ncbi:hypothetical protein C7B63_20905, partial [Bacillus halotolerans]|uniref:WG repeat-containing protein n=1 Tax=Bacillus halotolerans TaxID=260554 RepID=UPI000D4A2B09
MNKVFLPFLHILIIALSLIQHLTAQTKIEGSYDSAKRKFIPKDEVYRIYDFRDGLASFRTNDKKGIIDTLGNVIVPMKYDEIEPFLDGVARVEIFGDYPTHYGYIDK